MILISRLSLFILLNPLLYSGSIGAIRSRGDPRPPPFMRHRQLVIKPAREDGLVSLSVPPSPRGGCRSSCQRVRCEHLSQPAQRHAAAHRTRTSARRRSPGEMVHGKVVETVYAFEPARNSIRSIVSGRIISISPVSGVKRTLAFANGNFSPFHNTRSHLRCSLCSSVRQFR